MRQNNGYWYQWADGTWCYKVDPELSAACPPDPPRKVNWALRILEGLKVSKKQPRFTVTFKQTED